jgi:hypothetical protein
MGLAEWLKSFRELHEKARLQQLAGSELQTYRAGRVELARALIATQRLTLKPGETPRHVLRVAHALQVTLELAENVRAITIDLSIGGCSCLVGRTLALNQEVKLALRLPGREDPFVGKARVVGVKPQAGNVRVSFAFVGLSEEQRERLELVVFDVVLAQLTA